MRKSYISQSGGNTRAMGSGEEGVLGGGGGQEGTVLGEKRVGFYSFASWVREATPRTIPNNFEDFTVSTWRHWRGFDSLSFLSRVVPFYPEVCDVEFAPKLDSSLGSSQRHKTKAWLPYNFFASSLPSSTTSHVVQRHILSPPKTTPAVILTDLWSQDQKAKDASK